MYDIAMLCMQAALIAFCGLVAMVLRAEDEPKTPWTKANMGIHLKNFGYGVVAVGVVMGVVGYDITSKEGLLALLGVAYLGLSAIKAYFAPSSQPK